MYKVEWFQLPQYCNSIHMTKYIMEWFSLHLKTENINSHLQYLPNNIAKQTLLYSFFPV